jgi:hypothetical protein
MSFDWQTGAVLLVIVAALGYLARAAWRAAARRRAGACGGCADCAGESGPSERQIIGVSQLSESLQAPAASANQDRAGRALGSG